MTEADTSAEMTTAETQAVSADAGRPTCSGLKITGSATSVDGATWTYRATDANVAYDLTGTLIRPVGEGPFPAVVVSHGFKGSASTVGKNIGSAMRKWGVVVIATNYTHSTTTTAGLPTGAVGASAANVLRARKARQLLGCISGVDTKRVAAHGHSMGALLTGQLVGTYPHLFLVASHTAGGVSDTGTVNNGVATTTVAAASAIRIPYQMHHGDEDLVVPVSMDQRLNRILAASDVPHQLNIYPGYAHAEIPSDPVVLERVRVWYRQHGMF